MEFLSRLFVPSGIGHFLFVAGLLVLAFAQTRRWSWPMLAASAIVTLVFSSGMVAAALMSPLEHAHPAIHDAAEHPEASHIVVLTGWGSNDLDLPLSSRVNASSAYRVLLAVDLYRACAACDVIVSGDETTARLMEAMLLDLGVDRQRLRVDGASLSTWESARHIKPLVCEEPFFLVTSAGHMPRSLDAMRAAQLSAIPAPTDHQMPKDWRRAELSPRPESLAISNLAVREYAGRAFYAFRESWGD